MKGIYNMHKILVANRGEIAIRIINACKEMNIKTVAIYSEADNDALHTKLADEAICIGPASPIKSYLNIKNIIEAAYISGADAIHPGVGFLSESAKFAKICEESNIKLIGPDSKYIELLGNKLKARNFVKKYRIPVIPGSDGSLQGIQDAISVAKKVGYPIVLKATAGGGGKGIKIINNKDELEKNYHIVKKIAKRWFDNDEIYLEKLIKNPKHIEVQILADKFQNVVHLGERDCSIQRNHQKLIEETPSVMIDKKLRRRIEQMAIRIAKLVDYSSCGTVEFLVDNHNNLYFLEMNTRLQVEHSITEMYTGIDIVKEQIRIAFNKKIKFKQKDIRFYGHSIECRINAEDASMKFLPSSGQIKSVYLPRGNRNKGRYGYF